MTGAFEQGIEQLSLGVFTTLAPAAAIAYIAVAGAVAFGRFSEDAGRRIERALIIPIAMAFIGVMASTNHLGKPSNSLYVLSRIGSSPLSTEVACSVLFVGIIWITWFACFSRRPMPGVRRALLLAGAVAGLAQIWGIANAYHIATVTAWYAPFTAVNLVLQGLQGGIPTVLAVFAAARVPISPRASWGIVAGAAAATVAVVASGALQWQAIAPTGSGLVTLAEYAPFFPATIALGAVLGAVSCAIAAVSLARTGRIGTASAVAAFAIALAAVFFERFGFYCIHLTAGLSW